MGAASGAPVMGLPPGGRAAAVARARLTGRRGTGSATE